MEQNKYLPRLERLHAVTIIFISHSFLLLFRFTANQKISLTLPPDLVGDRGDGRGAASALPGSLQHRLSAGLLGDQQGVVDISHPGQQQQPPGAGRSQPPGQHLVVVASPVGRGQCPGSVAQEIQPPRPGLGPEGGHQPVARLETR